MSNAPEDSRSIIEEMERPQNIAPDEIEEQRFDDLPEPSHEGSTGGFSDLDAADDDIDSSRRVPPGESPKTYPAQQRAETRN